MKRVYFIGIGGIGMAALARYYMAKGYAVAGYDRTPSHLTHELEAEGAHITYTDSTDTIPAAFREREGTLVVYTPAVPADSAIMTFFSQGFDLHKRAWVLGNITRNSKSLCFSGTHGKTTTSSMAAHLLSCSDEGCNAFLGGIMKGKYNSNLVLTPASPWSVVEADEYDRSFHQLTPYIAVVNATDPDHLDIYGTEEAYLESFAHFTELIRPDGALLMRTGLKLKPRVPAGVPVYTFGRGEGDYRADNVRAADGRMYFDFSGPRGTITDIELGVPVDVNVDNATSALAALDIAGVLKPELARRGMASYPGVERRFEFHMRDKEHVIIDDYAHHPDEVSRSIQSVRALYPHRHLTVAFQPHLYSRTRDFAAEFATALDHADAVVLADIYPARELPIPGVSSEIVFDKLKTADKVIISKEDFVETLKNRNFDILLTLGAGDLSLYVPKLAEALSK